MSEWAKNLIYFGLLLLMVGPGLVTAYIVKIAYAFQSDHWRGAVVAIVFLASFTLVLLIAFLIGDRLRRRD